MANELTVSDLESISTSPSLLTNNSYSDVLEDELNDQSSFHVLSVDMMSFSKLTPTDPLKILKPKKIQRKLKVALRKEVQDELHDELEKSKNIQDKVDRANTQFKMKVLQTLKRAAIQDNLMKKNLELLKHEKVQKKIREKYLQCRAKMSAEVERERADQKEKRRKMKERQRNIGQRLTYYKKHWNEMATLKYEYQSQVRREMKELSFCKRKARENRPNELQKIVECFRQNRVQYERPTPVDTDTDMVKLVLHLITRRVVHDAASHVLCHLLTKAEECILNMSPAAVNNLNRSGSPISSELVMKLLKAARVKYNSTSPPPGLFATMLKTFTQSSKPTRDHPCPVSLYELKCPCGMYTPSEPSVVEAEDLAMTPVEEENSSVESTSNQSIDSANNNNPSTNGSSDSSIVDDDDVETFAEITSTPPPATQETVEYESPPSSSTVDCKSSSLSFSDESIQFYFEKYNIKNELKCEPNQTKYMIQNPTYCNSKKTDTTPAFELGLTRSGLCVKYRPKRQPLNSKKLYDLLHNDSSQDEGEDYLCHSDIIAEKVKVPIEVDPFRLQREMKPEVTQDLEARKEVPPKPKVREIEKGSPAAEFLSLDSKTASESDTTSDLFEGPTVLAAYWLHNSLRFLATAVLKLLCELITTTRPPVEFQFKRFDKFSTMEGFENFIDGLFEKNFDLINNDDLVLFIESFYHFIWMIPHKCCSGSFGRCGCE